jgi:hypothetical protein
VDEDVYASLQRQAEPFVDTPNDVLRRILLGDGELRGGGLTVASPPQAREGARVSRGQLLPHSEYRRPILEVLATAGGSLPVRAVLDQLRPLLDDRFTPLDRQELPSGNVIRWENRAQWVRFALVREGLLDPNAPRGTWRLTDRGWHEATSGRGRRR